MAVKKILVRSSNWVGDAIMALPLLENLRQKWSGQITVWCKPYLIPIFKAYGRVGVLGYEGLLKSFKQDHQFDACLLLTNSFSSALAAFLAGIPQRWGYKTDLRGMFLTKSLLPPRQCHQIDYFLNLAQFLDIQPQRCAPILTPLPEGQAEARQLRQIFHWNLPYLALAPGAAYGAAKCWPAHYYAQLADIIESKLNLPLLILGSHHDQSTARAILKQTKKARIYDLTGKTSLAGAMAIIKDALLVISNDSGLMHLTAALARPQIAIFGPTDPNKTSPYGDTTYIIYHRISCAPCKKRRCRSHRCMLQIRPQEVWKAVEGCLVKIKASHDNSHHRPE